MNSNQLITLADAYRAMFEYLDAYWREGDRKEDQIANLLSSMQYSDELGPTKPIVPSYWDRWEQAVEKAIK